MDMIKIISVFGKVHTHNEGKIRIFPIGRVSILVMYDLNISLESRVERSTEV